MYQRISHSFLWLKFQASGIQQRVDPRIAEKIHYLVGKGITNVNEMRRHLNEYLTSDLFCGQELPLTYNRRFWRSRKDHRKHIYRAIVANRFSKCDQKNLACFCVWGSNGCRFQNVRLYLLVFPPRGTGKDYIYIRNIMGCPMCSLGKENLVVKVVIKFSSLHIVQSFSCHVSFEPSNSESILSLSFSFSFVLFTLVFFS